MPQRPKRAEKRHFLRNAFVFIFASGLIGTGLFFLWVATLSIPDLQSFDERRISQSTKIYDRTGEILLFDIHEDTKRTVVPFDAISRDIKNATVAIEDSEFYQHNGVKVKSFFRAVLVNLGALKFNQGGSTITQQVVKNSLLTSEKKISRKIKEWVLAVKLEQVMGKEEILTFYLNEAPYGGSVYGIEEASYAFFDRPAGEVTLAQAAYLAALPQAPTYYSPYGNHREDLENRKNLVLDRMLANSFITEEEHVTAKEEEVVFQPRSDLGIQAPHFVMFIREYLEQKYGGVMVEEGGLKITTTLNHELQTKAAEIVKEYALSNEENFNAENGSLVAVDPKTGQILVMVGSRDYFDDTIDGNFNVALAHRQPGSAFKPFVYATAFKKGYTPDTVVFDLETEFSSECTPEGEPQYGSAVCYMPGNYDNVFRGPVTFREALAQSINIPAVKVLYLSGLRDSLRTAKDLGIESLTDIDQYGLTLVLGGGEVSPLDMTSAYGVFANNGVRLPSTGILRIEDTHGVVLEEFTPRPVRVLDASIAAQVSHVLSDNKARTPAFGTNSPLHFPGRSVAAKTGTTNDYRDAWIVGYTPDIAVAAWAGNNDNSPMEKKVAGFVVAPMWNRFMQEVLAITEEKPFEKPPESDPTVKPILRGVWKGGVTYIIDTLSGKLATALTPPETQQEVVVSDIHSILYWIDKDDLTAPKPKTPEDDAQFVRWEHAVRNWVIHQGIATSTGEEIPTELDDIHTEESLPRLSTTNIDTTTAYAPSQRITIGVTNAGPHQLTKVEFFINGIFAGSTQRAPFSFSFTPNTLERIQKNNTLRVVGYDAVLNRGETTVPFQVRIL